MIVDNMSLILSNEVMNAHKQHSSSSLSLLRSHSLAMAAQEEIERLILAGELPPGSKLGEAEMAMRLGVSRGPIREAFRGLEEIGLVRFEKNRGVFVREIDFAEADQNYVVRGSLESLAVRLLAERISDEEATELRTIIGRMEQAVVSDDSVKYAAENLVLHRRIFEMAGNAKLLEIYTRITKELMLFRRRSLAPHPTLNEHRDIVEKIISHDSDGAALAMLDHVESARRRILAAYQPNTANQA